MSYTQDEYREYVRLHVTNYAVVAYSVAPQASEVAGQGFSAACGFPSLLICSL
jgi:hypothetical protein